MNHPETFTNNYKRLSRFIGWMGITLPIILFVGSYLQCDCQQVQETISAFYFTWFISIFCGFIFTIGIFLFKYQGPDHLPKKETKTDRISTNIAGILALGVALFPTEKSKEFTPCNTQIETWWCGTHTVHMICAVGLFITLAFIALFVFTQTSKTESPTPEKLFRNTIYKICGGIIVVCIILSGICFWKEKEINAAYPCLKTIVFYFETFMLFAFGTSWLIKGETLFTDGSKSYQYLPDVVKPKNINFKQSTL